MSPSCKNAKYNKTCEYILEVLGRARPWYHSAFGSFQIPGSLVGFTVDVFVLNRIPQICA